MTKSDATKFAKGKSGNPNGRPAGVKSLRTKVQEAFVKLMDEPRIGAPDKAPKFFDEFLEKFQRAALDPQSRAFQFVAERLFSGDILDQIDAQLNRAKREDMDFLSFRFFKDLHDVQREAFLSKQRLRVIKWGRRTGKTDYVVTEACHDASVRPDSPIIYFGLTFERAKDLFFRPCVEKLREKGIPVQKIDETNGEIHLDNGSAIYISGTHTSRDRNKWRGRFFWKAYLDECQDMAGLDELFLEILAPAMLDLRGTLTLCGTGPKTRGTFWELVRNDADRFPGFRSHGDLSMNPYIEDHEHALAQVREQFGYAETDPIYIREFLGLDAYDDDALVLRFTDQDYFEDADLIAWLKDQSPEDIKFMSGLDYGYDASDAHAVIIWSERRNEKFLVWEYKERETDVTTLVDAIKRAQTYVRDDALFARSSYHREFVTWADTNEKKISAELTARYQIPVVDAIKVDKVLALQMLRTEVSRHYLKIRRGGALDQEGLRTIYARTEQGVLTRELDDAYHPDMMFAVLYAFRNYWLTHNPEHATPTPAAPSQGPNDEHWQEQFGRHDASDQLF